MKTFQNFNEDIEERRAQARERAIQVSQTAKEKVASYQQVQQQKRQELLAQKQREKEDEELVQKTTERVKRELADG
jgi:gas vesicle protein